MGEQGSVFNGKAQHGLDGLMADLDLGRRHPDDPEHPEDDLGDWFSNASPWLRRD